MTKVRVFRYDNEDYAVGQVIVSRGDHFDGLTDKEKAVELAIRKALPNGVDVRSASLYAWESEQFAKRVWPHSKKKYLYELEVDESDIRFKSDLNHFSDATGSIGSADAFDNAVARYCSAAPPTADHTTPRVEVLVSRATVISKAEQ